MYFWKYITSERINRIIFILFLVITISACSADTSYSSNMLIKNAFGFGTGSPISIYRDTYSSNSLVHISIYAPDFNSNPYAIDTIGDDSNGEVTVSTREDRIPYKLAETGPDTGVFAGYVILSGSTSSCSPVCGPTDGFLAAGGDDAITVSFTYDVGRTISYTSTGFAQNNIGHKSIPEFGSLSELVMILSISGIIISSTRLTKN